MSAEIHTETIKLTVNEIGYFTAGEGERTLVMLPGISLKPVVLSAQAVADAYHNFVEHGRLVLLDAPADPPEGYSIRDMARDAAEAMETLGIRNADVLGCSMGGMVAQILAGKYPSLVGQLALVSTLFSQNAMSRGSFETWIRLTEEGNAGALVQDYSTRVYSAGYFEQFKDAFRAMEKDVTPADLRRCRIQTRACLGFDGRKNLAGIRCRTMVMGSWGDRVLDGHASVRLAEKLDAPLYMFAGCGHALYDEAPDFKQRLFEFFRG